MICLFAGQDWSAAFTRCCNSPGLAPSHRLGNLGTRWRRHSHALAFVLAYGISGFVDSLKAVSVVFSSWNLKGLQFCVLQPLLMKCLLFSDLAQIPDTKGIHNHSLCSDKVRQVE